MTEQGFLFWFRRHNYFVLLLGSTQIKTLPIGHTSCIDVTVLKHLDF